MGDISEHFNRSEFECHDNCGFDTVSEVLVHYLELLRNHFNSPILVDDACRCELHNRAVGGVPHSQHVLGLAADIRVENVTPKEVADYLELIYPNVCGIGRYDTFTHFDVRATKARWDFRK